MKHTIKRMNILCGYEKYRVDEFGERHDYNLQGTAWLLRRDLLEIMEDTGLKSHALSELLGMLALVPPEDLAANYYEQRRFIMGAFRERKSLLLRVVEDLKTVTSH